MMVNITCINNASIGDEVLIFGENDKGLGLSPEAFAKGAGVNVYELISCLGPRIQRIFTSEEKGWVCKQNEKILVTSTKIESSS
jgi:alanine racemase